MFHVEQFRRLFRVARGKRFKYSPLIKVNIYKSKILKNFDYFASLSKLSVAPVLKSNAYGHDLVKTAKIFKQKTNIPFIVIDNYYESLVLENEGIMQDILIIGFTETDNIIQSSLKRTSFTISSLDQLQQLAKRLKKETKFHLKIDTGMNRQGISLDEIVEAKKLLDSNSNMLLEGICSHLSAPDNETLLEKQRQRWDSVVRFFSSSKIRPKYIHVLATSGISYHQKFYSNVARIGIGLFGFDFSARHIEHIQPALSLSAPIASVKVIPAGESIGYEGTYTTKQQITAAVIPVGFYEGLDKKLSNKGMVKIQNTFCPIIGLVSMNICMADVSAIKNISQNDQALIFSEIREDPNSIQKISQLIGRTPYEVLVRIPQHLRRIIV